SQILAFTFPHVGNVGVNAEDVEQMGESAATSARGAIFRDVPTTPANWRAGQSFDDWMKSRN
ncbi:MAG TPA: carbamoyl phosphate synthase small subunit, partial [Brevundimonas sp.]|nr:carbamoyl phosphate synthase small subunit [Brevundimonas sp.]